MTAGTWLKRTHCGVFARILGGMEAVASDAERLPYAEVYYVDSWHRGAVMATADTDFGWMAWVRFRQGDDLVVRRFARPDVHIYEGESVDATEL
jgi:hypothetical protein